MPGLAGFARFQCATAVAEGLLPAVPETVGEILTAFAISIATHDWTIEGARGRILWARACAHADIISAEARPTIAAQCRVLEGRLAMTIEVAAPPAVIRTEGAAQLVPVADAVAAGTIRTLVGPLTVLDITGIVAIAARGSAIRRAGARA